MEPNAVDQTRIFMDHFGVMEPGVPAVGLYFGGTYGDSDTKASWNNSLETWGSEHNRL